MKKEVKKVVDKEELRAKIRAERVELEQSDEVLFSAREYLSSKKTKVYEVGGKEAFANKNAPKKKMSIKEWEDFFKKY